MLLDDILIKLYQTHNPSLAVKLIPINMSICKTMKINVCLLLHYVFAHILLCTAHNKISNITFEPDVFNSTYQN